MSATAQTRKRRLEVPWRTAAALIMVFGLVTVPVAAGAAEPVVEITTTDAQAQADAEADAAAIQAATDAASAEDLAPAPGVLDVVDTPVAFPPYGESDGPYCAEPPVRPADKLANEFTFTVPEGVTLVGSGLAAGQDYAAGINGPFTAEALFGEALVYDASYVWNVQVDAGFSYDTVKWPTSLELIFVDWSGFDCVVAEIVAPTLVQGTVDSLSVPVTIEGGSGYDRLLIEARSADGELFIEPIDATGKTSVVVTVPTAGAWQITAFARVLNDDGIVTDFEMSNILDVTFTSPPLPPTVIPVPTPSVTDPDGPDNATWDTQEDTDKVDWTLGNEGNLGVCSKQGYIFPEKKTCVDFGQAPDSYVPPVDPEDHTDPVDPTDPTDPTDHGDTNTDAGSKADDTSDDKSTNTSSALVLSASGSSISVADIVYITLIGLIVLVTGVVLIVLAVRDRREDKEGVTTP